MSSAYPNPNYTGYPPMGQTVSGPSAQTEPSPSAPPAPAAFRAPGSDSYPGQSPGAGVPSQPMYPPTYPSPIPNAAYASNYPIPDYDRTRAQSRNYPGVPYPPPVGASPYPPPGGSTPPAPSPYGAPPAPYPDPGSLPSAYPPNQGNAAPYPLQGVLPVSGPGPFPPVGRVVPGRQEGQPTGTGGTEYGQMPQRGHYSGMYGGPSPTYVPRPFHTGNFPVQHFPGGSEHRGQKRALVIGCNHPRTNAELKGCINDARYMKYMLMKNFGFREDDIRLMTDDQGGQLCPTKKNMFYGFQWLVQGATSGDRLWLHFSGHGSQKRDYSGEERDGFNETLLPTDYRSEGQILDDEVNMRVVNPLPEGVVLHAVIDACHSGTAMDLQYYTKCRGGIFNWKDNYDVRRPRRNKGTSGGIAFQFGACKDSQVAQDTAQLSGSTNSGAATYSFVAAIESGGVGQSYREILCQMQEGMDKLAKKNADALGGGALGMLIGKVMGVDKQTPQLSCSERIPLETPLML